MTDIRVLIVDDVERVRQDLRTFLTLTGNIEIIGEASNGLEAIQLVGTLCPQVVLMDLEMPIMDGYEAARQIKAIKPACRVIALTIHAGEGFGLPSIWEALQLCGAERLGHGVRIVDDIEVAPDGAVRLGRLAAMVRDRRVPLELCPTSNVHSGAARSIVEHPIGLLADLRFRVTVNTDNRLMSAITLSREMANLVEAFGFGWERLEWLTINAMKSAFLPFDERLAMMDHVIKPGYTSLGSS